LSRSNSFDGISQHRSRDNDFARSEDGNSSVDVDIVLSDAERPNLHNNETRSNRTSFAIRWRGRRRDRRSSIESVVFAQSFWYVAAFLLTWVLFLAGQLRPDLLDDPSSFPLWVMVVALNPLMGFWNAFVYVKPWLWIEKRRAHGSWSKQQVPQTSEDALSFGAE